MNMQYHAISNPCNCLEYIIAFSFHYTFLHKTETKIFKIILKYQLLPNKPYENCVCVCVWGGGGGGG